MIDKIIGRHDQIKDLREAIDSERAELIAVYGRRRIGKTFLIKEFFDNDFDYYATGVFKGKQRDEIEAFTDPLIRKGIIKPGSLKTWMDVFRLLRDYLESLEKERIVVFLDELPWFDVPPGHFIKAFEWFWNSWGSTKRGLKLIVCGSATTWMTNKFISGKGGLYNRTTLRLHLGPFNLHETREMLRFKQIDWPENIVLEAYMVMGGVPYYLDMLKSNLSLTASIDRLFFAQDAPLRHECDFIMQSLFTNSDYYTKILDGIASKNCGVTRSEIIAATGISDNGTLTTALKNLILCDFIRKYDSIGKKEKNALYQLTDLFTLFHKRFVERYNHKEDHFWATTSDSPKRRAWSGIAFEQVCLLHLPQIKFSLGIAGVRTEAGSWTFKGNDELRGCQIDLLIVRNDKVINLCEMKYSGQEYSITADFADSLRRKREIFREVTGTKYALQQTLVTTWGLRTNGYSSVVNQCVTLSHLFLEYPDVRV